MLDLVRKQKVKRVGQYTLHVWKWTVDCQQKRECQARLYLSERYTADSGMVAHTSGRQTDQKGWGGRPATCRSGRWTTDESGMAHTPHARKVEQNQNKYGKMVRTVHVQVEGRLSKKGWKTYMSGMQTTEGGWCTCPDSTGSRLSMACTKPQYCDIKWEGGSRVCQVNITIMKDKFEHLLLLTYRPFWVIFTKHNKSLNRWVHSHGRRLRRGTPHTKWLHLWHSENIKKSQLNILSLTITKIIQNCLLYKKCCDLLQKT